MDYEEAQERVHELLKEIWPAHPELDEASFPTSFVLIAEYRTGENNDVLLHVQGDGAEGQPPPWKIQGLLYHLLQHLSLGHYFGEDEED